MKILFISKADFPDFQNDIIFHGGRSIFGDNFIDANRMWYMYKNDVKTSWNSRIPNNGKSFGRGFTLYGTFDDIHIDREDIIKKINNHFYDKIIYGSITRCTDYLDQVIKNYSKSDIIFIDGEDNQNIQKYFLHYGRYYKRELLLENNSEIYPINFAIPKNLIVDEIQNKEKDYASIIPGDLSTYIYNNQLDYYNDYKKSYFGITFKKGGWDCLRHYEILMNGCIPYFPDLVECPELTMTLFPKKLIIECNNKLNNGTLTISEYYEYSKKLIDYTKNYLTTEYVFNKLINE